MGLDSNMRRLKFGCSTWKACDPKKSYISDTSEELAREPWNVIVRDLLSRKSGFLSKFLTCLERTSPTIIDSEQFAFSRFYDCLILGTISQLNEFKEQAVIALLGLPSLLNQALTSAAKWHFTPNELHRREFQNPKTNTISRLEKMLFCRIQEQKSIAAWANDTQRYAAEHRLSVSIYRNKYHDFPDSLRDTIPKQAVPAESQENSFFF